MDNNKLKKQTSLYINNNKDEILKYLKALIRLPSPKGEATYAQELVYQFLADLDFSIDMFPGDLESTKKYKDYCPLPQGELNNRALNLVGTKKGGNAPKLMLFSHVDTELPLEDIWEGEAYLPVEKDGKIWGLGAADAKSGLVMILMAVKAVLSVMCEDIPGDLLLMSVLGKRGGAAGALTAVDKGYNADGAIYCHSAETQHGFREIKNYSMGTLDFKVLATGKPGVPFEDLDISEVNAIKKGKKIIQALEKWNEERRQKMVFQDGSFTGEAMTKLHFGRMISGDYVGDDPISFELQCRLYFPLGETVDELLDSIQKYLNTTLQHDHWFAANPPQVEPMFIRANPAETSKEESLIKIVENNINLVKGPQDFIYQHHGASDIRFPILYLDIPAVGIGSLAGGFSGKEWIDKKDLIKGVEILANTILDWWSHNN